MTFHFDPFTLNLATRQLTTGDRELHLAPKAFELLVALVENRPNVMSKMVLQQHLWPDVFVAEANLSNLVSEIREALGDHARAARFIRTAHGFGYAFCGEVEAPPEGGASGLEKGSRWLTWGRRRLPLSLGENIVGRDPDVGVILDASTVSRRHARLVVTTADTRLEDLGSKNGTFHNDRRISDVVSLVDGDTIGFGSLVLTFHVRAWSRSTETQVRTPPI